MSNPWQCGYCDEKFMDAEDWRDHQPCPARPRFNPLTVSVEQMAAAQARIRELEGEVEAAAIQHHDMCYEIAEREDRIAKLVQAGDAMCKDLDDTEAFYQDSPDSKYQSQINWQAAKEGTTADSSPS